MIEPLTVSSSQLDTFHDCRRKWWLEKVARLPRVPRGYLTFGAVLHECLQRWASADAHGRVPPVGESRACRLVDRLEVHGDESPLLLQRPGDPADVYPSGWETVEEKGRRETVTPNEAALIRRLVEQAVERGIVQRGDGRMLEREVRLPVIEGVELVGFIDVFVPGSPPAIHDHKCVAAGTEFYDLQHGRRRADDLGPAITVSMDGSGTLMWKPGTVLPSGTKDCAELLLMSGERVVLSWDHPVFTERGWVPVQDLTQADRVGVPRSLPAPAEEHAPSDAEVRFLACMMSDGCSAQELRRCSASFTNMSSEVWEDFEKAVVELGGRLGSRTEAGRAYTRTVLGLNAVLKALQQEGHKSTNKRLPANYYRLSNAQCVLFLSRFIACDGHINPKRLEVIITLANEGLIRDIRHLAYRLGVVGNVYPQRTPLNGKVFQSWRLQIAGTEAAKLLEALPPIPGKREVQAAALQKLQARVRHRKSAGRNDVRWVKIRSIAPAGPCPVFDLSVPETHAWIGSGVVLHNTFGEGSVRFLKQPGSASPNYLGRDRQLLTYAAATSILDDWDGPVSVRHNQFPKFDDGRGPRCIEAIVSTNEWAGRWAEIQESTAEMLRVREIKRWDDVPGPYGTDVCSKYGGCPFREICGRRSTVEGHRGRVERQLAAAPVARPNVTTGARRAEKEMSDNIFARARGSRPASQVQPQQVVPIAVIQPTAPGINGGVAPSAPAAPPPPSNAPPWANPQCTACRGTGFNSKGRPCPLCDALAKRTKRPTSSMYLISGDAQSGFEAASRPEKVADLFALGAPEAWSSRIGPIVLGAKTAEQATVQVLAIHTMASSGPTTATGSVSIIPSAAHAAAAECEAPSPEIVAALDKVEGSKRGRKPAGMTILIGCSQLKGVDRPTLLAQELLARLGAELAKDMGAASYWELDPFKRRDRLKQRADDIAQSLGRTVLLVAGVRDPDVDSLVSSLASSQFTETVVEGLR